MTATAARFWLLIAATLVPVCSSAADQFVRPMGPIVALAHVRVIDGTGGAGRDDQTVILKDGRISTLGPAQLTFARLYLPSGVTTIRTAGTVNFDADASTA